MATGNAFDPEAKYAQLGERVDNQGTRITNLETVVARGFADITSQIRSMSDDIRGGTKTQWPIIIGFCSVTITVLGGLGFLALQPIKDNIAQIRDDAKVQSSSTSSSFSTIVEKMVTQKEMEWRTARSAEDRQRSEASVKELRDGLVPRPEHERVWQNYDQRLVDQQRQIDEIKQAQGSVYGQRDFMLDLRERLDRVERLRVPQGG